MKILIKFLFFIGIMSFTFACSNAPEGQKVTSGEAVETDASASENAITYEVNSTNSVINWEGTKPTGSHTGTLQIDKGEIFVKNGEITGGKFDLNMNTITVTDPAEGEMKAKLEGHLKTGDFFEVETFPTGAFEITSVAPVSDNPEATHNITGNLILKGIAKSVTIPAKVSIGDNEFTAVSPKFTINRTNWNVMFHSGVLGTAKDKIINDEIGLQINLTATPLQAIN